MTSSSHIGLLAAIVGTQCVLCMFPGGTLTTSHIGRDMTYKLTQGQIMIILGPVSMSCDSSCSSNRAGEKASL